MHIIIGIAGEGDSALDFSKDFECARAQRGRLAAVVVGRSIEFCAYRAEFAHLLAGIKAVDNAFVFLPPGREAPRFTRRHDGLVESYAVRGAEAIERVLALARLPSAYDAFQAVLDIPGLIVLAAQVPEEVINFESSIQALRKKVCDVSWVIPHYGSKQLLSWCLEAVKSANAHSCAPIFTGIDHKQTASWRARFSERPEYLKIFFSSRPKGGPYLIRNALVSKVKTSFVCFQDSDDIPCANRLAGLRAAFWGDVGMVGSHEIRVDDFDRTVTAMRYPLDTAYALRWEPNNVVLHPTCAVRTAAFVTAGGFSTQARHSMDYQFLLRSFFNFRTIVVDKFLYVRRVRRFSLTTDPKTARGTPARENFSTMWRDEFRRVARGLLPLDRSALAVVARKPRGYKMIPIR